MYVSLTDFVQHAAAPGDELSDAYLVRLDELVGAYLDDGWRLGLVADHGMNAKPNVRFLGDLLDDAGLADAHVILPITDPYVVHHAALGSACWVHVEDVDAAATAISGVDGVEEVLTREQAAAELSLPADRIGDLVVLARRRHRARRAGARARPLRAARPAPLARRPARADGPDPPLRAERADAGGASNADVFHLLLGDGA